MYTKEALELELTEYFKSVLCTSRICVSNNVASNLDIRLTKRNKVYVSYYIGRDIRRVPKKALLDLVDRATVELEEAMLQEIKDKLDLNVSNENFLVAVHTHHKSIDTMDLRYLVELDKRAEGIFMTVGLCNIVYYG